MSEVIVSEKQLDKLEGEVHSLNQGMNKLSGEVIELKTIIPQMHQTLQELKIVVTAQAVQTEQISHLKSENQDRKDEIAECNAKVESNKVAIWKITLAIAAGFGSAAGLGKLLGIV